MPYSKSFGLKKKSVSLSPLINTLAEYLTEFLLTILTMLYHNSDLKLQTVPHK